MIYLGMKQDNSGILMNIRAVYVLPDDAAQLAEEITMAQSFGGTWQGVQLTPDQYAQALLILRQCRQPKFLNGEIIGSTKMQISSDKASIQANDIDTATLTVDVGDAAHTGNITLVVQTPESDGDLQSVVACVAGVATETLTTEQVGTHIVRAQSFEFGTVEIQIEGVE